MNTYRVTFQSTSRRGMNSNKLACETLWVEAKSEHHAVAEATMLAMAGTGNEDADLIGVWLRSGMINNVYATIETN